MLRVVPEGEAVAAPDPKAASQLNRDTPSDLGAHQRLRSSGFVQASKTILAGPLKVLVITSSRSDRRSTVVGFFMPRSLPFPVAITGFLLCREFVYELVEVVEAFLPSASVAFKPALQPAKRLRAQLVDSLLGARLHVNEPDLFQDPQVLGDLRLVEVKPTTDVVHRPRAGAEELDDS